MRILKFQQIGGMHADVTLLGTLGQPVNYKYAIPLPAGYQNLHNFLRPPI